MGWARPLMLWLAKRWNAFVSRALSWSKSPGRVPFHMPGVLLDPELEGWWQPGSVESFYQSNKVLQVFEGPAGQ